MAGEHFHAVQFWANLCHFKFESSKQKSNLLLSNLDLYLGCSMKIHLISLHYYFNSMYFIFAKVFAKYFLIFYYHSFQSDFEEC